MKTVEMKIYGQCPSGKNAVKITRTGHRYPSQRFIEWRRSAMKQLEEQGVKAYKIDKPCNIKIDYYSGDRRRRDAPGIVDAIYHLLDKKQFNVVEDDTFLGGDGCTLEFNNRGKSSEPRVEITIH